MSWARFRRETGCQELLGAAGGIDQNHVVLAFVHGAGLLHGADTDQGQDTQREINRGRQRFQVPPDSLRFPRRRRHRVGTTPASVAGLVLVFLNDRHQDRLDLEAGSRNREGQLGIPLGRPYRA